MNIVFVKLQLVVFSLRLTKDTLTSGTTIVLQDRGCSGAETITLKNMMLNI
jgi:hypothetical protein